MKDFERFQHYKDRSPVWIKLYTHVLEDYAFTRLSDVARCHLMMIWVLASRTDNKIPYDPKYIAMAIHANEKVDLDELLAAGFLEDWDPARARGKREEWASRYVPDAVRERVLEKHGRRCVECGATAELEIDHIIPISKGGTGAEDNLQPLCKPCNRRKRNRLRREEEYAEQVATQIRESAEPREEGEGEEEGEKKEPPPPDVLKFALAPYIEVYKARFDANPPGARFGKTLKAVERQHGADETLRRWKIFVPVKGELGPEYFARTWSEWAQIPPPNGKHKPAEQAELAEADRQWRAKKVQWRKDKDPAWWERMNREAPSPKQLWDYAYQHLEETG